MARTDDYPTPKYLARWAVDRALSYFSSESFNRLKFLEPGCGTSHPFYDMAVEMGCKSTGVDNRGKKFTIIDKKDKRSKVFKGVDFVDEWKTRTRYDIICTNPPFSRAEEFVRKSYDLLNNQGVMIFLLKLPFLCSMERIPLWKEIPLFELNVIQKRPSFSGDGKTDATEYAFYVWHKLNDEETDRYRLEDVYGPRLKLLDNTKIEGYPLRSKNK